MKRDDINRPGGCDCFTGWILMILILCGFSCSRDDGETDNGNSSSGTAGEDSSVSEFDELWAKLTRRSLEEGGTVYSDGNVEVLAIREFGLTSDAEGETKYNLRVRVYFKNISDRLVRVPLSTGDHTGGGTVHFPPIHENGKGGFVASWYVLPPSYYDHNLKGSLSDYEFTELYPGEVAVSRRLRGPLMNVDEVIAQNNQLDLEIFCEIPGRHDGFWSGRAKVKCFPVLSQDRLDSLAEKK